MSGTRTRLDALESLPWLRRSVPWFGGVFIAVIAAFAAFDLVRHYRFAVAETGRELAAQARVIAEQTARTVQAVDIVLRHVEHEYQNGALQSLSPNELHAYLREQAVGLAQIEGMLIADAAGTVLGSAIYFPSPGSIGNIVDQRAFDALRETPTRDLIVGRARINLIDGEWVFPLARRMVTPDGAFAGAVGARGRIAYFQDFYRAIHLDAGTNTALMHRNGTLLARHPRADDSLGKRFEVFDEMLATRDRGEPGPIRTTSPIDGTERFGAIAEVPGYPLYVLVTRDTRSALAPWRAQAIGTVARTLSLAVLAALLIAVLMRQLARVASARDEQKRAEDALRQSEGQLRQAQKLEAIGTLAGGIAHDFNNILAAILGYGEMAQKEAPAGTALRRHIDAALSAALRAKSLVERILAFSRSGMSERVPVRVQSIVEETLDHLAPSLPEGMRLERRLAAPDAAVLGDGAQVHQVVLNLCTNAIQSMRTRGTLTVSLDVVELDATRVATSVLAAGRYVRLRVADTGEGIPADVRERMFDPFFTTKGVGVGTGLGLSLVHGIVTDLGGGIDVASSVGEGAQFTVYLPWERSQAAEPVAVVAAPTGNGETVLLVDDEEALVRLGEETIAELGYEPVGCTSSRAALELFASEPARFDAVLTDESMPGLSGTELAAEIRKLRPDVPVILMSGYVNAALAARARAAGIADVLGKPVASRELARSLATVVRSTTRVLS